MNRKPGPAPWGLPPSGPASVPTRGRARLGLSPTGKRPPRKGSIGIYGAWSPERMAKAKRIHGGGDSPPGSRRPSRPLPASREGGGHQTATATAATAYLWRRGPAAQGQPRPSPGPHGARRPGKPPGRPRRNRGGFGGLWWPGRRGVRPLGLGASSPGREARSKPGSAHRRPNPPAPPGRGPSFWPHLPGVLLPPPFGRGLIGPYDARGFPKNAWGGRRVSPGPLTSRPFSPQALPHLWGLGGAGAPGQWWGRCPTPKGLALDLGWPPPKLVGGEGLGDGVFPSWGRGFPHLGGLILPLFL